jgi:hypothetical protein
LSEIARLLPDGFYRAYVHAFGAPPPADFLRFYEILCDAFYWGLSAREERKSVTQRRPSRSSYHFRDDSLLESKAKADAILAILAIRLSRRPAANQARGRRGAEKDR